ncbi:hypothetical protein Tco_0135119 [Tanacetum coccineum]
MEEINNFQQEPDEILYQAWELFKELLMKCPQHYLTEIQEMPKQPSKKWLNTLKNGIMEHLEEEERRQFMKDTLSKFMSESAKRHEENSNLIKEIQASTDAAIRNQGA